MDERLRESEEKKAPREPDNVNRPRRDPNIEYNPVIQPVDFQATAGVDSVVLKPIQDDSKSKEPTGDAVFVINIECPDGKVLELRCEKEDPLHYVNKQIVEKTGGKYPENKQILNLRFKGNELLNTCNGANLESYGICNGDTLQLSVGPITVYVEKKSGQRIELKQDPHDTIAAVKKAVEAKTNPLIPAQEQKLYFTTQRAKVVENELADNYRSLFKYGIADGDVMYLRGPSVWRPPTDDDGYPIFVECRDGKTLTLNVTADDDTAYTKLQIEQITRNKYPIEEQLLYFERRELSDDATLRDENIVINSVLQLSLRKIPIFVETREGKVLSLMVDPHETVVNVKKEVESMTSDPYRYPVAKQQLFNFINDEELTDNARTISKYGTVANSYLYLGGTIPVRIRKPDGSITRMDIDQNDGAQAKKQSINKGDNGSMKESNDERPSNHAIAIDLELTYPILVEKRDQSCIKLVVSPHDTVFSIKKRVAAQSSIPIAAQTLTFKSQVLDEDGAPISKYAIGENAVVFVRRDRADSMCGGTGIKVGGGKRKWTNVETTAVEKCIAKHKVTWEERACILRRGGIDRSTGAIRKHAATIRSAPATTPRPQPPRIHRPPSTAPPPLEPMPKVNKMNSHRWRRPQTPNPRSTANPRATPSRSSNPRLAPSTASNPRRAPSTASNPRHAPSTLSNPRLAPSTASNPPLAPSTPSNPASTPSTARPLFTRWDVRPVTNMSALWPPTDHALLLERARCGVYNIPPDGMQSHCVRKGKRVAEAFSSCKAAANWHLRKNRDDDSKDEDPPDGYGAFGSADWVGNKNGNNGKKNGKKRNNKKGNGKRVGGMWLIVWFAVICVFWFFARYDYEAKVNPSILTAERVKLNESYGIRNGDTLQLGQRIALKMDPHDTISAVPIFVETREAKVLSLMVDPHETVVNVKKEVESMTEDPYRYPVAEQQLFNRANDEELTENARTISKYGIGANSYLYLGGTIPVRIRKPDGSITRLDIDPNDPTKVMKELMNKRENIPINQQTLYFNNVELNDARPSKHYGIQRNDVIDLKLTFPIFVEKPDKSRIKLDVSPQDSVLSIKERVENKTHPAIPVAAQTLTFKKQVLEEDAAPISKYAIVENSVIYLSCDEDDPQALLEKILSRDAPPAERLDALNKIHKNLNVEKKKKYCDVLLKKDQIPLLICGHGVQILDEEPVRRTAIENVPDIMKQAMDENEEAVVASGALDETLDSLFKIYDDPRCRKIHPYAQKAINRIVEDVISRQNPQSINKLVEKLGEKVDLENISTPAVRQFAMQNLQKTMFPKENRLLRKIFSDGAALKKLPDDAPKESDLAPKGSAERLWFDTVVDDTVNPANNRVIGDKHRDDLWKSINEMITDPNPDNKQIGLNLAALFCKKNDQLFKQRLDGHARPIYQKWKFGPQKPYDLKMPPKAPKKKYKVDPLEPVDYRIKQQTGLQIGGMTEMPDL